MLEQTVVVLVDTVCQVSYEQDGTIWVGWPSTRLGGG